MQESDQLYLIASFADEARLDQAAKALKMEPHRLVVLGGDESRAETLASGIGATTELKDEVMLDDDQKRRLEWNKEHDIGPMLAVQVSASEGTEVRRLLTEMGGEMLWAPGPHVQVNDAAIDPRTVTDEPALSPSHDRLSDRPTDT